MRVCAWDTNVRSEKALQWEKGTTRKESDRRKKRLKGNQIEIPSCRYRGCSRYGVYKWKAMNRWIRGKEIKAEAEWTARWVFRYDKSPRKSPFLPSIPFSRFSPLLASFRIRIRCLPASSPLFLSCRLPLTFFCSFFFLFFSTLRLQPKKSRDFSTLGSISRWENQSRVRRERHSSRMNFSSTVIEMPFSAYEVNCTARGYSEIFRTDRVSPTCRFKLAVKIVDF